MIITDTGGDLWTFVNLFSRKPGSLQLENVLVWQLCGLFGGIVGAVLSVLNFFFMAVSADMAADKAMNQDVKGGTKLMQSFMMTRMLAIFVILIAFAKSGLCDPLAMVIPFVMVRPTITVIEFFRKAGDK